VSTANTAPGAHADRTATPERGAVFWPVGTGDSTTVVISDEIVLQIDLHDLALADDEDTSEVPVVDLLAETLPQVDGEPYLAAFALTHADKDHCLGFADLLDKVRIGELWATPRLWREYQMDDAPALCPDAQAFQEEAERRVAAVKAAIAKGEEPASGDRIVIIGYDTDHDKHAYAELPNEYKSGPGKSITTIDGVDCSDTFEAFIHAPFADDCASARNDTSLAMHLTIVEDSGVEGRVLMFGDLAHETIMKIFTYSEDHGRGEYLAYDVLLAPHHCSKKVMFTPAGDGKDVYQKDVVEALTKYANDAAVVVCSSGPIPEQDKPRDNPPHMKAYNRYREVVDEVIVTMSWPAGDAVAPVVFVVDPTGAHIVREEAVEEAAEIVLSKAMSHGDVALPMGRRLAAVAAAASVASAGPAGLSASARDPRSGLEQLREALSADRGGDQAPQVPVGFGRSHR
jgi:beta-lactamase superfamily II metal-dependent hydrolase